MAGSGRPQLIPNTVALRHGLVTWPAALKIGAVGHSMLGNRLIPNTCHIALGLKLVRPWLNTEYIGIRRPIVSRIGRQPPAGFTPRCL